MQASWHIPTINVLGIGGCQPSWTLCHRPAIYRCSPIMTLERFQGAARLRGASAL
jgi:hypothetical protein